MSAHSLSRMRSGGLENVGTALIARSCKCTNNNLRSHDSLCLLAWGLTDAESSSSILCRCRFQCQIFRYYCMSANLMQTNNLRLDALHKYATESNQEEGRIARLMLSDWEADLFQEIESVHPGQTKLWSLRKLASQVQRSMVTNKIKGFHCCTHQHVWSIIDRNSVRLLGTVHIHNVSATQGHYTENGNKILHSLPDVELCSITTFKD